MSSAIKAFFTFLLLFATAFALSSDAGERFYVDTFSVSDLGGMPSGWKTLKFPSIKKTTRYTVEGEADPYVKAVSRGSASAIYKEVDLDPERFRYISWRWKVEGIVEKGDARRKSGDDYAARVYVIFAYEPERSPFLDRVKYGIIRAIYGVEPPGRTVNYIWANRLPRGEMVKNPFTDKAAMVAVESGPERKGRWLVETRDVYEDYVRAFAARPPRIRAVAIMTDSDNTGSQAVGFYDDILFSTDRP